MVIVIIIKVCGKDVVFALDSSGSVGSSAFNTSLQFIGGIINLLPIGNNDTLTALMTFESTTKVYNKNFIVNYNCDIQLYISLKFTLTQFGPSL